MNWRNLAATGNAGPRQHLDRHQRLQRAGDTSHQDRPARPAHQRKKRRDRNRCDGEGGAPLCADGGGHLQPEKTAVWVNARREASLPSSSSESIDEGDLRREVVSITPDLLADYD